MTIPTEYRSGKFSAKHLTIFGQAIDRILVLADEIEGLMKERDELLHMNQQYVAQIIAAGESATIERCAQVVQNSYLPESDKAKLVAAIRALKDSQR